MLIKTKTAVIPTIGILHNIALKYIFDKGATTLEEQRLLEEGITAYSKKIDLSSMDKWEIKRIINALIADEHGYFDRAKLLLIEHRIDYRKMYSDGLPYVETEGRKFWNKS
jgi:hypothetical protein